MILYYSTGTYQNATLKKNGAYILAKSVSEKIVDAYTFGFNGQEKVNEIAGTGNHNTALFWEYDTRLGRRWNKDPKGNPSISLYATFENNPIHFTDILGDTVIVDNKGYILKNDNGKDHLVFRYGKENELIKLGKLGGKINVNTIYKNLLEEHTEEAENSTSPFKFKELVRGKGEWDLKNNTKTIYGYANKFEGGKTRFKFNGKLYSAPDLGNHHYGVVGLAWHLYVFNETFLLQQAGKAQMAAGTSLPEWQKYRSYQIRTADGNQERREMLPPYGDDPADQEMIKEGFQYYKDSKNPKQ